MTIAFIVDGHLEKKVVQRLCGSVPVRLTNLNGRDVSITAIVDRLEALIRLYKDRYRPVVVVIDREKRVDESEEIEKSVVQMLSDRGINGSDVIVSCPDRMIENWIIAGTTEFRDTQVSIIDPGSNPDGLHGKSVLKSFLGVRKIPYGETTIGVDMFCRICFLTASTRSKSYARLHRRIFSFCPKLRALEESV